jgi:signal transduction histidine kinase
VKSNSERLAILVNDLLNISQIEAGRILLSVQPLDLEEIADLVIAELNRRVLEGDKQVTILKQVDPRLPRVLGDAERVRQIFDNLLDNAYKYNSPGGQIIIRMNQVGREVQVDIQDTGIGVSLEDQPHIFERFFRGENSLMLGVSGTGLGLPIVQSLVQLHKGRIWLESTGIPGEGSTFSFTLPGYQPETGKE